MINNSKDFLTSLYKVTGESGNYSNNVSSSQFHISGDSDICPKDFCDCYKLTDCSVRDEYETQGVKFETDEIEIFEPQRYDRLFAGYRCSTPINDYTENICNMNSNSMGNITTDMNNLNTSFNISAKSFDILAKLNSSLLIKNRKIITVTNTILLVI